VFPAVFIELLLYNLLLLLYIYLYFVEKNRKNQTTNKSNAAK